MSVFRFKRFSVRNERSPMKVNTDGVLLGAAATLCLTASAGNSAAEPGELDAGCGRSENEFTSGTPCILDIGTGTGTIALMLAQRLEGRCRIEAIDIDRDSAEEAQENFDASPWSTSLRARCVPLQDYRPESPFDLIVSNPPYYDDSLLNPDSRKAGARHGFSMSYRDIILFCREHLSLEGRLAMILPSDSEKPLLRFAKSYGLYPERMLHVRTVSRKAPSRIIVEFVFRRPQQLRSEELTMMEEGHYTSEYSTLLEDFYIFIGK